MPHKAKSITPTRTILVQTDLWAIYRDIIKQSVQNVNEDRLHAMPSDKKLLIVAYNIGDTFIYSIIEPLIPKTTFKNILR